jgi:hypothetical protein
MASEFNESESTVLKFMVMAAEALRPELYEKLLEVCEEMRDVLPNLRDDLLDRIDEHMQERLDVRQRE